MSILSLFASAAEEVTDPSSCDESDDDLYDVMNCRAPREGQTRTRRIDPFVASIASEPSVKHPSIDDDLESCHGMDGVYQPDSSDDQHSERSSSAGSGSGKHSENASSDDAAATHGEEVGNDIFRDGSDELSEAPGSNAVVDDQHESDQQADAVPDEAVVDRPAGPETLSLGAEAASLSDLADGADRAGEHVGIPRAARTPSTMLGGTQCFRRAVKPPPTAQLSAGDGRGGGGPPRSETRATRGSAASLEPPAQSVPADPRAERQSWTYNTAFFRDGDSVWKDYVADQVLFAAARAALLAGGEHGRPRPLRVWSCGCSSGEELFSTRIACECHASARSLHGCEHRASAPRLRECSSAMRLQSRLTCHETRVPRVRHP